MKQAISIHLRNSSQNSNTYRHDGDLGRSRALRHSGNVRRCHDIGKPFAITCTILSVLMVYTVYIVSRPPQIVDTHFPLGYNTHIDDEATKPQESLRISWGFSRSLTTMPKECLAMFNFPTFAELEATRDKINADFHHSTKPVLIERLHHFGFQAISDDAPGIMQFSEQATDNKYLLTIRQYEITVAFQHIKTNQQIKICEISNLALSAHTILEIIINSIDCWLQYGVIYDYIKAQNISCAP